MLTADQWSVLIQRIKSGQCTPFLGAGASHPFVPSGADLAKALALEFKYPLSDNTNLIAVSQFVAIRFDRLFSKEQVVRLIRQHLAEQQSYKASLLGQLAELPLSLFITTNYDELMTQALKEKYKDVKSVISRWSAGLQDHPDIFTERPSFSPTVANPLIFHLHGRLDVPQSLVVTEDDYLEFLVGLTERSGLIPDPVKKALTKTSLLFIGYRLADWNFRVLLRSLEKFASPIQNYAVMLNPDPSDATREETEKYLTKYYGELKITVYWGTGDEFVKELTSRMHQLSST